MTDIITRSVAELQRLHPTYQRPLDAARAKKYAAVYNPAQERKPIVSVRHTGDVVVLDGQHTVEMLRILFGSAHQVECETRYNLTYEQEADLFVDLNKNRVAPSALDTFRSKIEARDSDALTILETIEKAGFAVAKNARGGPWDQVAAMAAVQEIYRRRGASFLASVLEVIHESCYGEVGAVQGAFFQAIGMALDKDVDRRRLMQVLSRNTPEFFLRKTSGGSAQVQCFERLMMEYNRNLSAGKRISAVPPDGWMGK